MSNSVWSSMNYTPPRGKCNFKNGLMSSTCSCLRFMLHPIKAATYFECDGCAHHASYHSMENPEEDAILKRWAAQETALVVTGGNQGTRGSSSTGTKRRRTANGESGA
ncbi:hypothetical protein K461DRAFT_311417 [Myriangium duriaei CBS 260.36]|uniref:Uncharacterized protein n=1 Tax=Myriangium duriaei CBS 260.36 TaxID=1168546 RepID=A0A9P4MJA7_9PEZI|nr:hypothetical protein K461DRAFT_311417 [Myriangium duriaei CBS 260.36]